MSRISTCDESMSARLRDLTKDNHAFESRLPAIFKFVLDPQAIGEKFTSAGLDVHRAYDKAQMQETGDFYSLRPTKLNDVTLNPKVVLESSLKAASACVSRSKAKDHIGGNAAAFFNSTARSSYQRSDFTSTSRQDGVQHLRAFIEVETPEWVKRNPSQHRASITMYQDTTTSSPPPSTLRYIKDPIHDQIPITDLLASFIDTRQFQRLRNIKQLGASCWVWPSVTHTRFEHSLGVAYLARLIASHLQRRQPELGITDRDIDCVEIAGLCHDLGHGPLSHFWDASFIPRALPDSSWKHEHASEMMFDALLKENNLDIPEEDQKFIKALISGDASRTPHEKGFLFDIVSNQRNGLDVDKIDYIHRDSRMYGEPIHHSPLRLINSARVLENQICYNIKDANQIYDLCASRFRLHKTFYSDKTAKAIEFMMRDALLSAEPVLKLARHVHDPEKFLYLTDDFISRIESSDNPELAESQKLFQRIAKRDLYKCVDFKIIDWPDRQTFKRGITERAIYEAVLATDAFASNRSLSSEFQESDIIVDFTQMHYGKKEKNPLDSMQFYSKLEPDVCQKAGRGCYSNLMPQYFSEFLLRVYTKKVKFGKDVQDGYRAVLRRLQEQNESPESVEVEHKNSTAGERNANANAAEGEGVILTQSDATGPTTPKMRSSVFHSRTSSFTYGPADSPFADNPFSTMKKKSRSMSTGPMRGRDDPDVVEPLRFESPTPVVGMKRKTEEGGKVGGSTLKKKKKKK